MTVGVKVAEADIPAADNSPFIIRYNVLIMEAVLPRPRTQQVKGLVKFQFHIFMVADGVTHCPQGTLHAVEHAVQQDAYPHPRSAASKSAPKNAPRIIFLDAVVRHVDGVLGVDNQVMAGQGRQSGIV